MQRTYTYRIPKRLHNNHPTSSREIKPQTPALQTTQQNTRALVFTQLLQTGFAEVVAHAAVVAGEVIACALEEGFDEVEHGCEL